jgi:chemotaxis protein CheC
VLALSEDQRDAVTELLNIGFGRAAASLSALTNARVELLVPEVEMCLIEELGAVLRPHISGEIASVHQVFSGPVAGDALLVLDRSSAEVLSQLLTDEILLPLAVDISAREVIAEVGNILLNACLGVFGNLLRVQVTFAVPSVTLDALEAVVSSLVVESEELSHAIVVHAEFRLKDSGVTGYLVMVLGVSSIERLMAAIDAWMARQQQS